jgi:ACS family 4-hydroxyphenylacetate permease-like MFS transporter
VAIAARVPLAGYLSQEDRAIRKAFNRIIPFLVVLFIISYLDRINISFAALSMNKDLKLTGTMFGLANTFFFVGYACCEIPSNLMLARFGARKWLARILVTWGIAATATMFASSAHSLYVLRLIVGITEAGFLPGVLLYLTYWFPATYRARATALFLIAQPVVIMLGAPISGLILDHANGALGIAGWRWLFLIEGSPAILLGVITFFYLCDGPFTAKWLTDVEKAALRQRLERESSQPLQAGTQSRWHGVFNRDVNLLALAYFALVVGLNTNAMWTPQIIREVVKSHSFSYVGVLTAIPALGSLIVMPIWGAHSDKRMERAWHYLLPMLLAACGWLLVALTKTPELRMVGLTFTSVGTFVGMTIFWTVPPHMLPPSARPVGIAFINSCGMIAAATSPLLVGFFKDLTHSWVTGLLFVTFMMIVSATLVFLMLVRQKLKEATVTAPV